jgi:hypothetical protein
LGVHEGCPDRCGVILHISLVEDRKGRFLASLIQEIGRKYPKKKYQKNNPNEKETLF